MQIFLRALFKEIGCITQYGNNAIEVAITTKTQFVKIL